MKYFTLDEDDRKRIAGRSDFILSPVSAADESRNEDSGENELYQREYIAVSPSDGMVYEGLDGFVIAPILCKSEKYLGCFSDAAYEKMLDEIKCVEPTQARKLVRYFAQCAELLNQSGIPGKYSVSTHTLQFVGYADYPGPLRGYWVADGVYVLMKEAAL